MYILIPGKQEYQDKVLERRNEALRRARAWRAKQGLCKQIWRERKCARESQRAPERVRESQREPERARENQREPERERQRESLWPSVALSGSLWFSLSGSLWYCPAGRRGHDAFPHNTLFQGEKENTKMGTSCF